MLRALRERSLRVFGALPRPLRRLVVRVTTPSFTVGAICVVERADGRVLLVRHSYRQHWGFPGGLLRRNEPVEEGAVREVLEETGIEVELVGEPAVVVAARHRRVDVLFRAVPAAGADPDRLASGSPEIVALDWFPPDRLPALQHEAAGALVTLARAVRAGLRA